MKNTKKKILSLLLTAALVLSLIPSVTLTAWAASDASSYTFDISEGNITVSSGTNVGTVKVAYGSSQALDNIAGTQAITIIGNSTSYTVTVASSIPQAVNITLSGVTISSGSSSAFAIGSDSAVILTLTGTNTLTSTDTSAAALRVPYGAALAITSASTGSLSATSSGYGAGIGGINDTGVYGSENDGTVTISGGTVTASSAYGAGIGGGGNSGSFGTGGDGGTVTISGGTVTASSTYGAGIGGGYAKGGTGGDGGTVTISGGTVTASSTLIFASGTAILGYGGSAGIGGGGGNSGSFGTGGDGGTVTISGGIVTATSSSCGAGIGGGYGSNGGGGGTVTVSGGTVTATSSPIGVGIGGSGDEGMYSANHWGTATISGGSVKAQGSQANIASVVFNSSPSRVYLTTVAIPGTSAVTGVSYTVGGGSPVACATDSSGKLYLWLPVTGSTTDIQITAGSAYYEASGTVSSTATNSFTASATTLPLAITTASLPYGVIGTAYSQTLTAAGGTASYTWSADSLPSGLSLDPDTGIISGTPTATGTYTVEVTVTDFDNNSVSESLTLTVYAMSSSSVPYITLANGVAFSVTLHNTDGKYAGAVTTTYGTITGTVSGSDTVLAGTLTGVPTTWTEITLTGGKIMLRSVTSPSTTVTDPSFN